MCCAGIIRLHTDKQQAALAGQSVQVAQCATQRVNLDYGTQLGAGFVLLGDIYCPCIK
jgi:hypothetical protein